MRIGFVPHVPISLIQGGAEVQAIKTKEAIEREGHQVLWLDLADKDFIKKIDIIHFFGLSPHLSWWAQLAKQYLPVVVSPIFYATQAQYKIFFNILKRFRGTTPRKSLQMAHIADALLPNSEAEARQIIKFFKVSPEKIYVVPNGVEKDFIGRDPKRFIKKYLKGWNAGKPFILSVQNIAERKNTLNLINAALKIKVPLLIIGSFNLAPPSYVYRIKYLTKKYPHLLKHIPPIPRTDLKDAYAAAHVFALPSHLETPGLSSLEAGLNGCNLVLGDCAPVKEYFSNISFIVKQDSESIAKGLKSALSVPRNYFNQATIISQKYTWERAGKTTLQIYKNILSKISYENRN